MGTEQGPTPHSAPADDSFCDHCKQHALVTGEKYCTNCGFPQRGTVEERGAFLRTFHQLAIDRQDRDERVKRARNILYLIAVLNLFPYIISGETVVIAIGVVISLLFVGLAIWAKYKPFPAILTAFILFVLLNVLSAIEDPTTLFKGILLKIFGISALLYALRAMQRVKAAEEAS